MQGLIIQNIYSTMQATFTIYQENPVSHYINIKLTLQNVKDKKIILKQPRWRPGRYELGNFAKNVQNFFAFDSKGNKLLVLKPNTHTWEILNENIDNTISIQYNYYANEYNAGACFANENILYFNPVHLLMQPHPSENSKIQYTVKLNVPDSYKIVTSLKVKNKTIVSNDFDELVDSPIVATKYVKTFSYKIDELKFFVHTIDLHQNDLDEKKLKNDFYLFTQQILRFWGTAPFKEYHFIIHLLPYNFYHGVEHLKNTVICLGPANQVMNKLYDELLGVSSHELFHSWNIKTIRPAQMQKYDYYSENYSELGFVYEGFTTYYGDKLLWQSNVFSDSQFFRCISERLNKHYLNFGKHSQSLLNSSIDTWVDGYANFAPHKKVSIYDEGCIFAMTMDLYLILKTNKHRTLRDVCLKLYDAQVNKNQPYTFEFIMNSILETTKDKKERDIILETLLFPNDYLPLFEKVSSPFGFYIEYEESENWWERYFGFKISEQNNSYIVNSILPDSPAYSALSLNDEIIGINNIPAKHLFSNKNKLPDNSIQLTINRFHQIQTVNLKLNNKKTFFQKLHLKVKDKLSSKEKDLFTHYKKLF